MTILVKSPDGATVQFPDGTDAAVINDVMAKNFKAPTAAATPAAPPDKFQQAAIDEQARLKAAGGSEGAGLTRRLAHGATLGADSTILAAAQTPLEMMRHGTFDPREGYNYAKAREDQIMGDARTNTGMLGTAAEVLGGGVAGAGLASGGVTAARLLAPEAGLVARSAASAVDAGALGGFSGAMEGNGIEERAANAAKGASVGAVVGGAAPAVISAASRVLSPVISNIRARANPRGYAEGQVARAIHESGVSPNQLSLDVLQAGNEGQGAFTLADAMGNPGQRMLSTVARAPGTGRTAVVDTLESRQAGQGRRIANALLEGFDTPQTAAQTEARLTSARGAQADAAYGAVRDDAHPVDLVAPINHIDQIIGTRPVQVKPPANVTPAAAPAPGAVLPTEREVVPSLLQFIASKGGLKPDAELEAIGLVNGHRAQIPGQPGFFGVVRKNGTNIDRMREAAEEAGYLRGENGATSTPRALLDAIDAELRGQKKYPQGYEGYQTKRERIAASERDQSQMDSHLRGLESDLAEAGHGDLPPEVKRRGMDLMAIDRMHPDDAVERAISQMDAASAAPKVAKTIDAAFPGDRPSIDDMRRSVPLQANDSVEAILGSYRARLARVDPHDFSAVQRIRGEMADAAQNARQNGYGNRARLIGGAVRELDAAMENASPGFRQANANFRQASQNIEAIDQGRTAAMRGRVEDTIPAFQALGPAGQQAFRAGYVDPLVAQTQSAAFGANKARPLINDAFRAESDAMAPGADMMQRRIGREQTMFETRGQALGGSRTMDNINDHAAMSVDPHVIGRILMGDFHGALRGALQAGSNVVSGNTPAVRREVADILLQRAPNINPAALERMVEHTINRLRSVQEISRNIGRAMVGGLAATAPGQQRQWVK